jgi:two-component system NarL family sensor kinase
LRLLRSPVALFLVVGLLTVAAIFVGTNYLAGDAASDEAIAEARRTNEVLANSVAQPDVPRGLVSGATGALDRFDRSMRKRLLIGDPNRVNIWSRDGRILYSTELGLIGQDLDLDADQLQVLRDGGTGLHDSDPDRPENRLIEADSDQRQVQIYTRMQSPEGRPLLFEAYYDLDDIEDRQSEIFGSFRWLTLAPLTLLIVLVTLLLSALTRQLTAAGKDRERLLRSAIDASDAERRRIARDLHDGVVQDLAGTAFSVSAVARSAETSPGSRETLASAGHSLRSSLTSLRSLVAEIHPPDLHAEGLASALADLIAPAGSAGMQASASVEGAETASHQHAALVWRVAQEAVRNAIRHSGASTLAVTVRGDGSTLALEVVDDGTGFDPAAVREPDRYGLRGLRSLVADSGGTLEVRSSPGEGTTVRMEVDAQ